MQVIPLGAAGAKRYFAPAAETTARQDGWIMVQMADAGVMKFVGKEMTEELAQQVVIEVLRSGKQEYLLAGLLVEQGKPWTPASAAENAEWFASISDRESKQLLRSQFIPLLAGFFLNATPSSGPSPNASETKATPRRRRRQPNGAASSTEAAGLVPVVSGSRVPAS